MFDNEGLEYNINIMFQYIIKNPKGEVVELIDNVNIEKKQAMIAFNLFFKNGIIEKKKLGSKDNYFVKEEISPIIFGKAINMGIEIEELEKFFKFKEGETLKDLTQFISSGNLDEEIKKEEQEKRNQFISEVEKQCKAQVDDTLLGILSKNVESTIKDVNDKEVSKLLNEISLNLNKELKNVCDKLKEKKLSNINK